MQVSILRLPKEILHEILLVCNPFDLLSLEMTCRTFLLSATKRVWMRYLADLDYSHAPDVGVNVNLDSLKKRDVKKLVVRALTGYSNWNFLDSPRVAREQAIRLESHLAPHLLLPGCKYMLVESHMVENYFGIWGIKQEKTIARQVYTQRSAYTPRPHGTLLEGGKVARVVYVYGDFRRYYLSVVDFNLIHDQTTQLFLRESTDEYFPKRLNVTSNGRIILASGPGFIHIFNCNNSEMATVTIAADDTRIKCCDTVRDVLVCVVIPEADIEDKEAYVVVARLSRIFDYYNQSQKPVSLKVISEEDFKLPYFDPDSGTNICDILICDPKTWGSPLPCRILIPQVTGGIETDPDSYHVQVHCFYLKDSEGLNYDGVGPPFLEYATTSKPNLLKHFSGGKLYLEQSVSGRCLLLRYIKIGHCNLQFALQLDRLWEDDVHIVPTKTFCGELKENLTHMEYYGGTVWYRDQKDRSLVVLKYF